MNPQSRAGAALEGVILSHRVRTWEQEAELSSPLKGAPLGLQAEETDHKLCQPRPEAGARGEPLNAGGRVQREGPVIRVRVGDGEGDFGAA